MATVCFYFQVHQPFRLRQYGIFDGTGGYFDDDRNAEVCRKVAAKCYLPANRTMLELIRRFDGRFRISYSITGVVLEQFERYCPEVLESFQELARTGCVEFLAETYYHSLAILHSRQEFVDQIEMHRGRIRDLFGQDPTVFRNTELVYSNDVAHLIAQMGFRGVLCEGLDRVLAGRSPAFCYEPPKCPGLSVLLKNYRLSDDIAFRFGNRDWKEWPLDAGKFAAWVNATNGHGHLVNLFLDYETIGEHQWADTGIFDFLRALPDAVFAGRQNDFATVSQVIGRYPPVGEYDVPHLSSWADTERDLSAWMGNAMQTAALEELYRLEEAAKACGGPQVLYDWRRLQTSDHFYYMCTKWFADGDVHKYFNPYESPYDAYVNFMNVLGDLASRVGQ
ncbi:MAG: glycoside hydrolase family 57 protein [Phycisphaerales bacterium]|nr:MAG: glycoside hydrolase family 57 protein [Phycisphaerales bacterium]